MTSSNPILTPDQSSVKGETASVPGGGDNSTALDQWRGLALVFVLISHGFFFTGRVHGMGRVGVNLFFFISGLLVFRSLSRSRDPSSWSLTRKFWKRRARRLYPAMASYVLAMLLVVLILHHWTRLPNAEPGPYLRNIPFALIYGANYWPYNTMSLGHLWSLSCEMQFYLLAPLIFLLGGRSAVRRHLVWGTLLLVLTVTGLVGAVLDKSGAYRYHFEIAVWPMMLGFYCEYQKDWFRRLSAKWFSGIMMASLAAFGAIIALMLLGLQMKKPVVAIGTFAFVPCLLAYVAGKPIGGPVGRALTWMGERTYSIYLWQEPLTICEYLPVAWHSVGAVVSAFVGGVWFRLFERPFLSAARKH
jgi:peptidoglycan/LPS O-acetylase OafA/YrhL